MSKLKLVRAAERNEGTTIRVMLIAKSFHGPLAIMVWDVVSLVFQM